jgi:hypothetical protein
MGHSKNIFMEERLVSNCCGAVDRMAGHTDQNWSDLEFCPDCLEPCSFVNEEEEMKVEILTGKKDTNE